MDNYREFQPRWSYDDGPNEQARCLRDTAMSAAALAHKLSPDETVTLDNDGEMVELSSQGVFWRSKELFGQSYAVNGQSHLSRAVTYHHEGRAAILAGQPKRGLSMIRIAQPKIESMAGNDRQLVINALGGAMLAEAAYGLPYDAKQYRRMMRQELSDLSPLEQLKRRANNAASIAVASLRWFSMNETSSKVAQRALRGPILHKPVEQ